MRGGTIGVKARPFIEIAHSANDILFKIVGMIMRLAPVGVLEPWRLRWDVTALDLFWYSVIC